jgi:hypothetical protein
MRLVRSEGISRFAPRTGRQGSSCACSEVQDDYELAVPRLKHRCLLHERARTLQKQQLFLRLPFAESWTACDAPADGCAGAKS